MANNIMVRPGAVPVAGQEPVASDNAVSNLEKLLVDVVGKDAFDALAKDAASLLGALGSEAQPAGVPVSARGATGVPTFGKLPPPKTSNVVGPVNVSNMPGPQSETDVAIDPTNPQHLIGSSNDIQSFQAHLYESFDGGKTWKTTEVPHAPAPFDTGSCDPSITFDAKGNAYFSYLGMQFDPSTGSVNGTSLVTVKKPAGATSWGQPVTVPNANADKNLMTVDRNANSAHQGNVYVSWDNNNADQSQSLMVATSSDGGQTYTSTKVNNHGTQVIGADPAVGPNGEVYTAWMDYSDNAIYINSSLDGGKTWGGTDNKVAGSNIGFGITIPADPQRGVTGFPSIDVDRSNGPNRGTIYCAYPNTDANGRIQAYLTTSKDGGKTWSTPKQINQDSASGKHDHFLPRLAVDDSTGAVSVTWYDTRNDPANKKADVFVSTSTDGGKTFGSETQLTTTPLDETGASGIHKGAGKADANPNGPQRTTDDFNLKDANGNGYGDYMGIAASQGEIVSLWSGITQGSQAEDIFSAVVNGSKP